MRAPLILLTVAILPSAGCVRGTRLVGHDSFSVLRSESNINKSHKNRVSSGLLNPGMKSLSHSIQNTIKAQSSNTNPRSRQLTNADVLEDKDHSVASLYEQLRKDPRNAELRFSLACLYHRYAIFDKAFLEYQKAIRLDPDVGSYHEALGRLWRDWGRPQTGIGHLLRALQLDPTSVEIWNTLGTIYDALGNSDKARESYHKALQLNPDLAFLHANLCFSYLQTGALDEAILYGETAVRLNPACEVAHNNLGLAYGFAGDFLKALEQFKLAGAEAKAHNNLGVVLLKKERIEEAMEQFRTAARLKPSYRIAVNNYRNARSLHTERPKGNQNRVMSLGIEASEDLTHLHFPLSLKLAGSRFESFFSEMSAKKTGWRPEPTFKNATVTFEIVRHQDTDEAAVMLGSYLRDEQYILAGFVSSQQERSRTKIYYQSGFVDSALALAHRIPGNQEVLKDHKPNQSSQVKIILGKDILPFVKKLSPSFAQVSVVLPNGNR